MKRRNKTFPGLSESIAADEALLTLVRLLAREAAAEWLNGRFSDGGQQQQEPNDD